LKWDAPGENSWREGMKHGNEVGNRKGR